MAEPSQGAVAVIRQAVERSRAEIAEVLPRHMDAGRLITQCYTLLGINPDLQACTPRSVVAGVRKAAELGLELSGPLGQAYLIPRWNGKARCKEAVFQVGYRGVIDLAYRSGKVLAFHLRTVHQDDNFVVTFGTTPGIIHAPAMEPRGPSVVYYSVAFLVGGANDFEVMSLAEVLAHRQQYSPPPEPPKQDYSAWATAFDQMAQKTTALKLGKRLSLSPEFVSACVVSDYGERGVLAPSERLALTAEGRMTDLKERLAQQRQDDGERADVIARQDAAGVADEEPPAHVVGVDDPAND